MQWPAFWRVLVGEGIFDHHVWILQCVYFGQCGEFVADMVQSKKIQYQKRRAARVRAKPTFVLCGVTMGDARMEGPGRNLLDLHSPSNFHYKMGELMLATNG